MAVCMVETNRLENSEDETSEDETSEDETSEDETSEDEVESVRETGEKKRVYPDRRKRSIYESDGEIDDSNWDYLDRGCYGETLCTII
jgi:hypothetical protein